MKHSSENQTAFFNYLLALIATICRIGHNNSCEKLNILVSGKMDTHWMVRFDGFYFGLIILQPTGQMATGKFFENKSATLGRVCTWTNHWKNKTFHMFLYSSGLNSAFRHNNINALTISCKKVHFFIYSLSHTWYHVQRLQGNAIFIKDSDSRAQHTYLVYLFVSCCLTFDSHLTSASPKPCQNWTEILYFSGNARRCITLYFSESHYFTFVSLNWLGGFYAESHLSPFTFGPTRQPVACKLFCQSVALGVKILYFRWLLPFVSVSFHREK